DLEPSIKVHLYAADVKGPKGEEPDVIVGTPQKVKNSIRRGELDLSRVFMLILDEADDLIKNDQEKILAKLCDDIKTHGERDGSSKRVQVILTSATLASEEVQDMIKLLTTNAQWVDTKGSILGNILPDTVHHAFYRIHPDEPIIISDDNYCKNPRASVPTDGIYDLDPSTGLASQEIKLKKPKIAVKIADAYKMDRCMVFCRTNLDCDNLETYLHSLDGIPPNRNVSVEEMMTSTAGYQYSCCVVAGARGRQHNQEALEAFKQGVIRFLICTDVAARGIDISGLPFELMLTLPPSDDAETYIHRIGRVGRAGHMGLSIAIVAADEVRERVWFHKCNKPRGKGCHDTRLVKDGGCTIWFDEWKTVKAIEKIIKEPIPEVDPRDLSIPELGIEPPTEKNKGSRDKPEDSRLNPITHKDESLSSKRRLMWLNRLTEEESNKTSSTAIYGQLVNDRNMSCRSLKINPRDVNLRNDTQIEERKVTRMFLKTLG
ncbi:ATP-dependent RNA helicase ddx1, partial [Perkinsus chesapeaki]